MIDRVNELNGTGAVGNVKQRRSSGFGPENENAADALAVSSFAREMAGISLELNKMPDVREDRVNDLKKRIDEGTYNPDLKALADRLIWAGINKIED